MADETMSLRKGRNLPILVGVVVLVAAITGVVLLKRQPSDSANGNESTINTSVNARTFDTRLGAPPVDTDADGLSDSDEQQAGTAIGAADTDKDGLSDYDEVKIYHSDPKKTDTDGDGNSDGKEVKNGFSPTASGKLYDTSPQAITNASR